MAFVIRGFDPWERPSGSLIFINLTVRIPDRMAARITAAGGDLERRALEALVLEEYRAAASPRTNSATHLALPC